MIVSSLHDTTEYCELFYYNTNASSEACLVLANNAVWHDMMSANHGTVGATNYSIVYLIRMQAFIEFQSVLLFLYNINM